MPRSWRASLPAALARSRNFGDAIDHAVWEQAFLRHPISEHRIPQLGKSHQHFLGYFTVALDVVAGHESERREPAYASAS